MSITVKGKKGKHNITTYVSAFVYGTKRGLKKSGSSKIEFTLQPSAKPIGLSISTIGNGAVNVMVTGGYPPYRYYWNGSLIRTSNYSTVLLRNLVKSRGILAVEARGICGQPIRRAEQVKLSSTGAPVGLTDPSKI